MREDAESFLGVESECQSGGSASAVPPALQPAPESPYRGYGGWLAFFCVVQIFVAPIFALISGAVSVSEIGQVSDRFPGLVALTVVELIGDLGAVGYGVWRGSSFVGCSLGLSASPKATYSLAWCGPS